VLSIIQSSADPPEVLAGLGQHDLALESSEARNHLEVQHLRVAQHHGSGLDIAQHAPNPRVVGRGVVLHLLARREVVASRRLLGLVSNLVPPAERRERLIRDLHTATGQLLVHAHQVAFAVLVQLENLVAVRLGELRAHQ
jgi:hypothetical protein